MGDFRAGGTSTAGLGSACTSCLNVGLIGRHWVHPLETCAETSPSGQACTATGCAAATRHASSERRSFVIDIALAQHLHQAHRLQEGNLRSSSPLNQRTRLPAIDRADRGRIVRDRSGSSEFPLQSTPARSTPALKISDLRAKPARSANLHRTIPNPDAVRIHNGSGLQVLSRRPERLCITVPLAAACGRPAGNDRPTQRRR